MIDIREPLIQLLAEAAEIEHNLLCPHLYATSSLAGEGEGGLSHDQSGAFEQWRRLGLSIALEEKLRRIGNAIALLGGGTMLEAPRETAREDAESVDA